MSTAAPIPAPFEHLWLATDLAPATGRTPWSHALGIATAGPCDLHVIHAHESSVPPDWSQLPLPREHLVRWGMLRYDDGIEAFRQLGFQVHLHAARVDRPLRELRSLVTGDTAPDLLVMGTHRPALLERLWRGSVAEQVSRTARGATLVVPDDCTPFVDPDDGSVSITRILVPVGDAGAVPAYEAAARLARTVAAPESGRQVTFLFLHVGPWAEIPQLALPTPEQTGSLGLDWTFETLQHTEGDIVERVLAESVRRGVDLIAMATRGHDSLEDSLFGSRTERVLRDADVPVLIAPAA